MTRGKRQWREIHLLAPRPWDEILPSFLEEKGYSGLWIDEEEGAPGRLLLRAYMDEDAWTPEAYQELEAYLKELSLILPSDARDMALSSRVIEEEDWAAQWLPFFRPLRIGPVWIRPGEKPVKLSAGEQEIVIDPGEAFGTGHHETTQLCLEQVLKLRLVLTENSPVLDLGTGSGILAMFAARLGFKNVLALDTDPAAVAVAAENVAKNGLDNIVRVSGVAIQGVESRFSLILANLTASIHRQLFKEMVSRLDDEGWLVLSGLLREESESVARLFLTSGLRLVHESPKNDWTCLSLQKTG
jgi:ribosomal protein L11 methyltransferase